MDLADRKHAYCVLDGEGEVVKEGGVVNAREALAELAGRWPAATVVMDHRAAGAAWGNCPKDSPQGETSRSERVNPARTVRG